MSARIYADTDAGRLGAQLADGVPLAAGAIEGVHAVDWDLDYIGFQPWATSVEADGPDEAMETAVERMQGERDAEDDE